MMMNAPHGKRVYSSSNFSRMGPHFLARSLKIILQFPNILYPHLNLKSTIKTFKNTKIPVIYLFAILDDTHASTTDKTLYNYITKSIKDFKP